MTYRMRLSPVQEKIMKLKEYCELKGKDTHIILGLIRGAGIPEKLIGGPYYLMSCGGHNIQVHETKHSHGDLTTWERKTPALPSTNESLAGGMAYYHPDLASYLGMPGNLEVARQLTDEVQFVRPEWCQDERSERSIY